MDGHEDATAQFLNDQIVNGGLGGASQRLTSTYGLMTQARQETNI